MFEKCSKCEQGLECQDDYASLKSGYWWKWRNETSKYRYKTFINNLLQSLPALGKDDVQYPHPIPKPYHCPEETSCEGGLDALCAHGYEGPLCAVCSSGYFKQFNTCKHCPSKTWIALQLSIVAAICLLIIAFSVWISKRKRKNKEEHSLTDVFLSKIKIAIGFYQVTYGLLEAFSYIQWPDSLQVIGKYSEILQLNVFQIAPVHCLSSGLTLDAFGNMCAIMAINATVIAFASIAYRLRKVIILRNPSLQDDEKSREISQTKELVYWNLFFFLYVTYLSTCAKTASVLPLTCRKLCLDEKQELENEESCFEYLKADYSIRCHDLSYNNLFIVAYISSAYIIALPAATFIVLWNQRRRILASEEADTSADSSSNTEMISGLRFLFENYKTRSWFWELIETSRKVIITSGLMIVGQESRSYIGLAWVIAGMYGVLFAWMRPVKDAFENRLMSVSLAVTVVNLGIGAVSRIPTENLPSSDVNKYMDTVLFNILVLGANSLVIALLLCKGTSL